jgi:alkylated DNA nucleotide flippase Atl1
VRAVGLANRANPVGIVVPCHRVIGSDGSLTGYAAGVDRKRWLLRHEGAAFGGGDQRWLTRNAPLLRRAARREARAFVDGRPR